MKKIIITLFLNALVTLGVIGVLIFYAEDAYPASALYNLKRLNENLVMSTKITPETKADYYLELIEKRYSELGLVYQKEQYQHILITSLRYVATTGNATEYILNNNLPGKKELLKSKMIRDINTFEQMKNELPPENEDGRFLTDTVNYTAANIRRLN